MLGVDLKEHLLRQLDEIESCADNAKEICAQARATLDAEDVRTKELHDVLVRLDVVCNMIVTRLRNLELARSQILRQ